MITTANELELTAERAGERLKPPRLLTPTELKSLLWHFLERTPNAALGIALGIGTGRLLDGCSISWALSRGAEHLAAVGVDMTPFLEAQAQPAPVSNGCEAVFLEAARGIASAGKDIPT